MKKILITSNLYRPNIGGIENSLYFLSIAYISLGYEVHLVTSTINNFDDSKLPLFENIDGIKVYRYQGSSFLKRNRNALNLFKKLISKNNYTLFIARGHIPTVILKIAGASNIAYVLPGINIEQNKIRSNRYSKTYFKRIVPHHFHHLVQCAAVRLADRNYVFSENMANQVHTFLKYNRKVYLTKPGIDSKRFITPTFKNYSELRKRFGYKKHDIILLGVGRFYDVKGFEYLIQSLNYLPAQFKLLLVGDGDNRLKYQSIAEDCGLCERLEIIGPVHDTSDYYQLADIYVLSSIHESFGQTMIEALASGLPIVAFNSKIDGVLTATTEITNSENSVYADSLSSKSLSEAILKAHELINNNNFNRSHISQTARDTYSWKTMAKSLF